MEFEAIGSASPAPMRPIQPSGVTAELAQARARLRESAPPDRWEAVVAEVRRLQAEEGLSPLRALQAVQSRLAAGWVPAR
jgi:hypothetical protein